MRIADAGEEVFGPIALVVMKMYRYYNQYAINGQSYFSRIHLLLLGYDRYIQKMNPGFEENVFFLT